MVRDESPGKVASSRSCERPGARKPLPPGDFGYCNYGGYGGDEGPGTGFFRVENVDGRWWFVDPDGHLFLSPAPT